MRDKIRRQLCVALVFCLVIAALPARADETDLATLQKRLLVLGYEIGAADGILGKKTSSAILLAQTLLADAGSDVRPTGHPDEETAEQGQLGIQSTGSAEQADRTEPAAGQSGRDIRGQHRSCCCRF